MSALKELTKYIETKHPANDSHYIKLILEAIREGEKLGISVSAYIRMVVLKEVKWK